MILSEVSLGFYRKSMCMNKPEEFLSGLLMMKMTIDFINFNQKHSTNVLSFAGKNPSDQAILFSFNLNLITKKKERKLFEVKEI